MTMNAKAVFQRLYDLAKTYEELAEKRGGEEGEQFMTMEGAIVDAIVELSDLTDYDVDWMLMELGYFE